MFPNLYIQPQNIDKITTSWLGTISELCPELLSTSNNTKNKFKNLLLAFSHCHEVYNCGQKISDSQIKKLGNVPEYYVPRIFQHLMVLTYIYLV